METKEQTGLILTERGARAACQVGVLPARSQFAWAQSWAPAPAPAPAPARNALDIVCGSSAGAIHAAAPACRVPRSRLGASASGVSARPRCLLSEPGFTNQPGRLGAHEQQARTATVRAFFGT